MTRNQPMCRHGSAPTHLVSCAEHQASFPTNRAYLVLPVLSQLPPCLSISLCLSLSHFSGEIFKGSWLPFSGGQRALFPPQGAFLGLAAAKGLPLMLVLPLLGSPEQTSAGQPPEQEMLGGDTHNQGRKSRQYCSLFKLPDSIWLCSPSFIQTYQTQHPLLHANIL